MTANFRRTALHVAARYTTEPGVVTALLNAGAAIEAEDINGYRAIHMACMSGNICSVKALISQNAQLNEKTKPPLASRPEADDNTKDLSLRRRRQTPAETGQDHPVVAGACADP